MIAEKKPVFTFRKKLLFNSIILLFFIFILIMVEVILRVAAPSLNNPFVIEQKYDGIVWYRVNRGYLEKYFPANTPLVPELKPTLFRKEKEKNTYRIVCLGGSSMFGTPYQMTSTISGIVRKQLRHLYPQKEFEVINLGASAINSNVVLDLAGKALSLKPDLVLVYMGHNEFYGPDGVGESFLLKKMSWLIPLKYKIRDLTIFRGIERLIGGGKSGKPREQERNLMKQVSQNSRVELKSADSRRIFRLFESNLTDLIHLMKKNNIPVIVSDVSSNLQFAPFAYPGDNAPQYKSRLKDIRTAFQRKEYSSCLAQLEGMYNKDSTNAMTNFWLGRTEFSLGRIDSSRRFLARARDLDLLKFRAPGPINKIITKVCRETDTPFISSDSLLSANSPGHITGYNVFWEHLHPNTRGYYEIANLFLSKIVVMRLIPGKPAKAFLPLDPDSLSICWLDVAYADLSIRNLVGKWPFSDFKAHLVTFDRSPAALQRVALDVYNRKIVWDEGCLKSAAAFISMGDMRQARTTYEALIGEYPYNYYVQYLLANLLKDQGDIGTAAKHYRISIQSNPRYLFSRTGLGLIEINLGNFDEAIRQLTEAGRLLTAKDSPALNASINYGLSAAYANKNDLEQALDYINKALKIMPDYDAARKLKQQIMLNLRK